MVRKKRGKKTSYSMNSRYFFVFLLLLVIFSVAAVFMNPFSSFDLSTTGFDVAEIQANCGGAVACQCGDDLTSSRVLTASDNLTACGGAYALQILGPHIILDCNKISIASNGSASGGVAIGQQQENITIKNCHFDGFTGNVISLYGTGNGSLIMNNNFSNFNGSGVPQANAINLGDAVKDIIIRDNVFNTNSTSSRGINLVTTSNISIINNTFKSVPTAISFSGLITDNATDIHIMENIYNVPQRGIKLDSMIIKNITIRNENTNGSIAAYSAQSNAFDLTSQVRFINATSNTHIFELESGTRFRIIQNLSSGIDLITKTNATTVVGITFKNLLSWTSTSLNFSMQGSGVVLNYTILTPNTFGTVKLYRDDVLNQSFSIGSNGQAFAWFTLNPGPGPGPDTVIAMIFDVIKPVVTSNVATSFASTTTSVVLNVTTSENASCRYGSSNVSFANLPTVFNSTTNLTHTSNITVVEASSYTNYVICQDTFQLTNDALNLTFSVNDTTAPVVTLVSGNGTHAVGTTSVVFNVSTNENASCRYDTTSASFGTLASAFASTTNQSHTSTLSVTAGTYAYYYACQDRSGNANSPATTSFTVTAAATTSTATTGGSAEGRSDTSDEEEVVTEEETTDDSTSDPALAPVVTEEAIITQDTFIGAEEAVISFALVDVEGVQQDHSLTFAEVNENEGYVVVILESTPQEITLVLGEAQEEDLTEDGVSDVRLTLQGITGGQANVLFETIGETLQGFIVVEEIQPTQGDEESTLGYYTITGFLLFGGLLVVLLGLFVVALYYLYHHKK